MLTLYLSQPHTMFENRIVLSADAWPRGEESINIVPFFDFSVLNSVLVGVAL